MTRDQRIQQGAQVMGSLGFQRLNGTGADRVEPGASWWRQIRVGIRAPYSG